MEKLSNRYFWTGGVLLGVTGLIVMTATGCQNTPIDLHASEHSPAPLRVPPGDVAEAEQCGSYEESLTGGKIFTMYCGSCHQARSLAERPFANYKNVAAHMRVRANLTGVEYAKLMEWLRRWHDVPDPNPPPEPSPKRLIFSQPINELRDQPPANPADQPPAKSAPAAEQPK